MKRLLIPSLTIAVLAAGTAAFTQSFEVPLTETKGPVQPINFSHEIHAGQNQMDCLYCHNGADKSPVANIPAASTCMGCHKIVATNRPEIQKLVAYVNNNDPIPWVEVYRLPDHVKFNHERHVKAGVQCADCHGPVDKMPVMYQANTLKMGWCLTCHRSQQYAEKFPANMDCLTCHH